MSRFIRSTATALVLGSLTLMAAGCNKSGDDAADGDTAPAAAGEGSEAGEATLKIAGLKDEKAQISYMIGMEMAKSLEPIKDEIDLATLQKAIKTVMDGEKTLLTDEQVKQVGEAFSQRMQAKQIAEMMATAKKNAEAGAAVPGGERQEAGRADHRIGPAVPGGDRRHRPEAQAPRTWCACTTRAPCWTAPRSTAPTSAASRRSSRCRRSCPAGRKASR